MDGDIEINVIAHVNDAELNRGVKGMKKSLADLRKSANKAFDNTWEGMNWDEKSKVITAAAEKFGAAWSQMTPDAQRAAFADIVSGSQKVGDAVDSAAKSVKTLEQTHASSSANMTAKMVGLKKSMRDAFASIPLVAGKAFRAVGQKLDQLKHKIQHSLRLLNHIFQALLFSAIFLAIRDMNEAFKNLFENNLKGTQLAKDVEDIKNKFTELKFSVIAAFLPLIEFAIPYIKIALDWLIQLFNRVAMITAAFTGQKEVLQVVAGSAAALAKNTEKAKKAAQGALAAFDQINVLQKPDTGDDITTPSVATEMVPITDDILDRVAEIKQIIAEWWNDPLGKLKELGNELKTNLFDWIQTNIPEGIRKNFIDPLAVGFYIFVERTKELLGGLWDIITDDSLTTSEKIKKAWGELKSWFTDLFITPTRTAFANLWQNIKTAAAENLKNISEPLRQGFYSVLEGIRNKFISIFLSVQGFVNSIIQDILAGINNVISGINAIPGLPNLPSIPMPKSGRPSIPRLATGGIVPAGASMLAMIGEGRESEAVIPLSQLEEMLNRVMQAGSGGNGGTIENVIMLDGEVLYRGTKRVERRHGKSLIAGGMA